MTICYLQSYKQADVEAIILNSLCDAPLIPEQREELCWACVAKQLSTPKYGGDKPIKYSVKYLTAIEIQ